MKMDQMQHPLEQNQLRLRVRQIRHEANGINSYELVDPAGARLPPFTAGAHIDVHLPNGVTRQYSLSNSPHDRYRYVIAVLRDENGRGGSKNLHETLHVQDLALFSHPRNNFELAPAARKVILLAGGIGITPIKSMAHALEALGIPFDLHYCARNADCVAFFDELEGPWKHGRIQFHFDDGDPAKGLDLTSLLRNHEDGTHVFFCGPGGFIKACSAASAHWPADTVHLEHFKAPERPGNPPIGAPSEIPGAFVVKIASTGSLLDVPADRSIADVLAEAGMHVETSCQSGLCGTCRIRYLEGEVDHQDYILSDGEHTQWLTSCVSRAKGKLLVLDL